MTVSQHVCCAALFTGFDRVKTHLFVALQSARDRTRRRLHPRRRQSPRRFRQRNIDIISYRAGSWSPSQCGYPGFPVRSAFARDRDKARSRYTAAVFRSVFWPDDLNAITFSLVSSSSFRVVKVHQFQRARRLLAVKSVISYSDGVLPVKVCSPCRSLLLL